MTAVTGMVSKILYRTGFNIWFEGNTDGITYFQFHDVIEKETVRVQGDEPCAPDYIDPAWLSPDYVKSIQDELNEDCTDDCQNEADVDACEAKCSQVSRSSGSVRSLVVLTFLNPNFSASNASKIVVHGDRRAQLSLECANGVSVTWLSVPVVAQVATWPVATISWKLAFVNLCRASARMRTVPWISVATSPGVARISDLRIPIWTKRPLIPLSWFFARPIWSWLYQLTELIDHIVLIVHILFVLMPHHLAFFRKPEPRSHATIASE